MNSLDSNYMIKGRMAPLLKWPGGKRSLLKDILPILPQQFNNYYEPFFGGGALFFHMQPYNSFLSDMNDDLINCYTQVRDNPIEVINRLQKIKNNRLIYYSVRASNPQCVFDRAARFIYLTELSFNGIYRTNLDGEFNVPYGNKTHINPCNIDRILGISHALKGAELRCSDFSIILENARSEDLIYFDPPYTVSHNNNGFIKYNAKIFSWDDQARLAAVAEELRKRGCYVIVSNADHESVRDLYPHFFETRVLRTSIIAAASNHRGQIAELIFSSRS